MKKVLVPIALVVVLAIIVFVIGKVTYSIYKSNKEITVHSTSGNMVCNASIVEDDTPSIYGYKKLKVTITNYEEVNNEDVVTDVPIKYNFTLSGPNGTKFREYDDTTTGRTIQNGQGFTNTNSIVMPGTNEYEEFTTTKSSKDYYFEVMTTSDGTAAQTKNYSVDLKCTQTQPVNVPAYTASQINTSTNGVNLQQKIDSLSEMFE